MHPSDLNPPNVQYNSDPAPFGSFLNHIHHPRHMRVILIGAELAGLCFAYKLQRSFEDYGLDFPGVYATGEEVPGYFNTFAKNHSLEKFMKTEHKLLQKRKQFERVVNGYFGNYLKDSPTQAQIRAYLTEFMNTKLASSSLEEKLVPEHSVGCWRPTPGVGYLEALTSTNTKIVFDDIKQVTPYGIVDNEGTEHPVDVLVCATGFDTAYKPRFPLPGAQGKNLEDEWAESTDTYMATAIPDFPNYFMFFGPNNPFASGSYISAIQCQADYMLKFCDRLQTENIRSFAPKKEAVEELAQRRS